MMSAKLSVIILTFNEELNLPKCLNSIKDLNAEVFVLDSNSTDNTKDIALNFGAQFFTNPFETHVKQWMYALEKLPIQSEWILGIDADQELMPQLVEEINLLLNSTNETADGYYIKRRNYFLGIWIKHGGYYPIYLLKLFKKSAVFLDPGELMDHHFYVKGKTQNLKNDIIENNLKEDIGFWSKKHIKYAELQATEEFFDTTSSKGNLFGSKNERKQKLKSYWNRMPLFIRPGMYFFYRYILLFGFLDGRVGLIFHYLQAYWYRMLVDSMILELKRKKNV